MLLSERQFERLQTRLASPDYTADDVQRLLAHAVALKQMCGMLERSWHWELAPLMDKVAGQFSKEEQMDASTGELALKYIEQLEAALAAKETR